MINVDPAEIEKFSQLAHLWWDPRSEFKPLHDINPLRLHYIDGLASLAGKKVLDVGCGGGILAEAMARKGAQVTGTDLAVKPLKVAQLHVLESGLNIDYRCVSVEDLARDQPGSFDVVTCMEMLEHVPDPGSVVEACARLLKPEGWAFFSTINRNARSYLFAVVGAEYVLKLLPKGTHEYSKFIRPSELSRYCRDAGMDVQTMTGMTYNPFSKKYSLEPDTRVNYILSARGAV